MKISIIGDGGWGTALAVILNEKGHEVFLWSNFPDYAAALNEVRENIKFLPGVNIPKKIIIGSDLDEAVRDAEILLLAVPSKYMRSVCKKIHSTAYKTARCILSAAKGLEIDSLKRMSEVIAEELPGQEIAVLSGPSHSEEVAGFLPTAVVVSGANIKTSQFVQNVFNGEKFRIYTSDDVTGVELGGALKNVIAIAVGICDGLGLGDNAKSALMTRGIAEMARLGVVMGGKKETFAGLAGIGDLILTCISKYGRNLNFGRMIAHGKAVQDALSETEMVVEGVTTAKAAYQLGQRHKVELPIINEVYQVLYKRKSYKEAMKDLMLRTPKQESV